MAVKKAYRTLSLELHPDKRAQRGRFPRAFCANFDGIVNRNMSTGLLDGCFSICVCVQLTSCAL